MHSNYSKFLKGTNKFIEFNKKIEDQSKNSKDSFLLSSGSRNIDHILNGGFLSKSNYLIFGANRTGKTQFCHQLCVQAYKKSTSSIYIDTENTFRPERIKEIGETQNLDPNKLLKSIFVSKVMSNSMLLLNLKEVENLIRTKNIQTILIDSLNNYYRLKQAKSNASFLKIKVTFLKILKKINDLTNNYRITIIATAQVAPIFFDDSLLSENPVGIQYLNHFFSEFLYLRYNKDSKAYAHLVNSLSLPEKKAFYKITSKGIVDSKI